MTIKRYIVFTAVIAASLAPLIVIAATTPCPAAANGFVPLACSTGSSASTVDNLYASPDIPSYLNNLFKFALSAGAMAAVLRLVYAGYLYMGTGVWSSISRAREIIRDTIFGIFLLLAIYLILFQINPELLNFNAIRGIRPAAQPSSSTQGAPTNPIFGGVGGASNIQKDPGTGQCFIPNPATGGLDATPCP